MTSWTYKAIEIESKSLFIAMTFQVKRCQRVNINENHKIEAKNEAKK